LGNDIQYSSYFTVLLSILLSELKEKCYTEYYTSIPEHDLQPFIQLASARLIIDVNDSPTPQNPVSSL